MEKRDRLYGFDNLRALLIFCVVFAHFLETIPMFPGKLVLYRTIYSFHMPAFLFLNGYFARSGPARVLSLAWPYVLFQTAYRLFDHLWLSGGSLSDFTWNFTSPYWLLWYLMTLLLYSLLLPLLEGGGRGKGAAVLLLSAAVALLAGYDSSVGYYLSLSRAVVFLPFFLLGYYSGKARLHLRLAELSKGVRLTLGVGSVALAAVAAVALYNMDWVTNEMLFGSYSYAAGGYSPLTRLALLGMALAWLAALMLALLPVLERPIPLLSTLGRNTMPVFLLHGFLVKAAAKTGAFVGVVHGGLVALGVTAAVLFLFGNPAAAWLMGRLTDLPLWLVRRVKAALRPAKAEP